MPNPQSRQLEIKGKPPFLLWVEEGGESNGEFS